MYKRNNAAAIVRARLIMVLAFLKQFLLMIIYAGIERGNS